MKHVLLSLLAIILFSSCQHTVEHIEFGLEISGDATPHVLQKIHNTDENSQITMSFEKGNYHFYPDKAFEIYRHISNHDDALTRTAFPVQNKSNLIIDGQGSTFIFHGMMIPFIVDDSKNITIKNVSMDWATPFHSEGLVIANNEKEHTYDLQFSDEYPYEIRNGNLIFLKEYYEHTMGQAYFYDPETKAVAHNTLNYSAWWSILENVKQKHGNPITYKYENSKDRYNPAFNHVGRQLKSRFEEVAPGIVRVYNHAKKIPPVGLVQVMKGAKGVNRTSPALHLIGTENFKAINVNVLHAGGMGVIAEFCSDMTFDNFNVVPSEGRHVSATADGTHFINCRGKLTLKNCQISNQLDDGSNIHGAYYEVVDILENNQLGIKIGHFQQQSLRIGFPGDTIAFISKEKSIFPYEQLTIKSVKEINSRYMLVTFNEPLSKQIKAGDVIENLSAYPEVLIQNCEFSGNRAHGLLISTPKKTIIENCFFNTDMGGIHAPAHIGHWFESGNACHLTIRNNTFQDCTYGGSREACITLSTFNDYNEPIFKDITITNNTFNHFDNLILSLSNVDKCLISGNTIRDSKTYPQQYPDYPAFRIHASSNINFENNTYKGTADVMIEATGMEEKIKFQ